jgi:NAD(P)-dependent dehydrogenase (short-subunit alcohol dehydrogenase family)
VVTAGAGGIGAAIAGAFAAAGARVHVCDVDEDALRALTEQRSEITASVCDVSDRSSVQRFVAEAAASLGGIDVLVNNAGIAGPTARLEDIEPDAWERVLAVNLTGTFHVTRLVIPHLRRSDAGVILMMSSLAGRVGYPQRSPYAVSKWGLIGLTKTLAMELGDAGIRVNAILPGAVAGPRLRSVLEGRAQASGERLEDVTAAALANQSIKEFVHPEDIGALAVFLASDSARLVSGQTFPIDGDSQSSR